MVVFFSFSLIVFCGFKIEEVGLTESETSISWLVEIPPKIPPALFEENIIFLPLALISSEFSSPVVLAAYMPRPISTPLTALILIIAAASSVSSLP